MHRQSGIFRYKLRHNEGTNIKLQQYLKLMQKENNSIVRNLDDNLVENVNVIN